MTLDLRVLSASAWPSSMPPPAREDWRISSTIATAVSAGITQAERDELFSIAADSRRFFEPGVMSSTERRRQPGRRATVMQIAKRLGVDDVIREAVSAAVREPDLGSTDAHVVRGTQAAAVMLLRMHVAGVCASADA